MSRRHRSSGIDDEQPILEETAEAAELRRAQLMAGLGSEADAIAECSPPLWRVDKIMPKEGVVVVAGSAKLAAKSFTTLHMARCIVRGLPFCGFAVCQGSCVLANMEDGWNRLGYRAKMLATGMPDNANVANANVVLLKNHDTLSALTASISDPLFKADVIIIDPMIEAGIRWGLADENDPIEMAALMRPFRLAAQKCHRLIILVHHFRKAGDMARGSSALQGAVDGWWNIFPGAEDDLRHFEVTLRDGPAQEFGIRYTFGSGSLSLEGVDPEVSRPRKKGQSSKGGKREALDDNELYAKICTELKNLEGGSISPTALINQVSTSWARGKRVIDELEHAGLVEISIEEKGEKKISKIRWVCDNTENTVTNIVTGM